MIRILSFAALAFVAIASPVAQAQLRLPAGPSLPTLPNLQLTSPAQLTQQIRRDVATLAELVRARAERIAAMLNQRSDLIEADSAGEPAVRGELVLISPPLSVLGSARADGFVVVRDRFLDALDLQFVTVHAPPGWDTPRALRRLHELDPQLTVDLHHLYLESGVAGHDKEARVSSPSPAGLSAADVKVGLIDGGVETDHATLRGASIHAWGCGGHKVPSAHGTALASLLVGRADRFRSAVPKATLYAADVYCNDPVGGSVEAVAMALGWLASEQVPVVNISLVGPANGALEAVVKKAASKGMLLVAAVGNDGPAARPLYPAAYADVIAVTAVDSHGKVIPEACRGPHVAFAAPGSDMAVAAPGRAGFTSARGTSFAAPLVAGMLAARMPVPDVAAARSAVAALARIAVDAGAPGRDDVYGHGIVASALRTEPAMVLAH